LPYKCELNFEMGDLAQLFQKYGSDKDLNGYSQIYQTLFDPLIQEGKKVKLLEIGIGTMLPGVYSSMVGYSLPGYKPGGSLRAWRDFFQSGSIYGVDVQPDTQFKEDRITTSICDSTNKVAVDALMYKLLSSDDSSSDKDKKDDKSTDEDKNTEIPDSKKFDIIIDDGSHWYEHQYQTLKNFFPYVKEGGYYIIEDVTERSPISTDPTKLKQYCNDSIYFFVGVKNNICVIYKKKIDSRRAGY